MKAQSEIKAVSVRKRRSPAAAARARAGFSFVSPAMLVMLLLVVYPLAYGIYISFFKTNLLNRWDFVGFTFYIQSITDPGFLKSLFVTVLYPGLFAKVEWVKASNVLEKRNHTTFSTPKGLQQWTIPQRRVLFSRICSANPF